MKKTKYLLVFTSLLTLGIGTYTYNKLKEKEAAATEISSDLDKYYQLMPKHASVFTDTWTYIDKELTVKSRMIEAFTNLKIKSLIESSSGIMLFQMEDNSYVPALKSLIHTTEIAYKKTIDEIKTVKSSTRSYKLPQENLNIIYNYVNEGVNLSLQDEIEIDGQIFVSFENQGELTWIKKDQLTDLNPSYEKIQRLLNDNYNSDNFSIYIQDLASEESASINPDSLMYSASLAKLPILYWVQKQILAGLDPNQSYKYIDAVNNGSFAFQPAGSGVLSKEADNKDYKLSDLISYTGKHSDNVASNLLAYYLCETDREAFDADISQLAGRKWNLVDRLASSRMSARLMVELHKLNGQSYQALKNTDFDNQRICKYLPGDLEVAHKIGEAYDFHHDVAIVESSRPYVISIETQNDVDIELISRLSKEVYDILKEG
ncbi:serine hydrolase [Streptococcaceae bacterium ESL0687]|nr:serine hydrolase [Streptococcaceae bacterium ESL0687]